MDALVMWFMTMFVWAKGTALKPLDDWFRDHAVQTLSVIISGLIAYYFGGALIGRLVRRLVKTARHREWHRKDIEKRQDTLAALFVNTWRIVVLIVVGVSLFRLIFPAVDLAPMFASAGIIGIALGFGAQSMIKDFLSGIFIISENQYRVGDIVDIEGSSGTVERIGTRSTVIRDVDGNVHYFPNGMVMHVINKTMGYSMARFIIAIQPSADLDKAVEIINQLGVELSHEEKWRHKILEAPEFVSVGEFTGTSVDLIIAGKTQPSDQWSVIAEMRRRLLEALEKADIALAIIPTNFMQQPKPKK